MTPELQKLHDNAVKRACNMQADLFAMEAAKLLSDIIHLVGVNRMDDVMRQHGFSVEPSQQRRAA